MLNGFELDIELKDGLDDFAEYDSDDGKITIYADTSQAGDYEIEAELKLGSLKWESTMEIKITDY